MTIPTPESHGRARRLFDDSADDYLERSRGVVYSSSSLIFQRRIAIVESFVRRLGRQGANALDYGMGPAVFAECCTAGGMRYLGVDISVEMVGRARRAGLTNCEFIVGDLDTLQPCREQMDLVLAIGLIDYLEDVPDGISRLAACVKPGGHLIFSFRNRFSVPCVLRDVSKAMLHPLARGRNVARQKAFFAEVHEKSFDVTTELAPQLRRLGFSGLETRYFNCSPIFFNFPLPRTVWRCWYALDELLAQPRSRFLCSGGVVAATKQPN